jgi:3-isopropylmalate/(R)-2-methylmalate dehydratase small subunit
LAVDYWPLIIGKEREVQPFITLTGTAVPLRAENVDTDQIIPARYLTAVTKAGMGDGLFAAWRYGPDGVPTPGFVLNQAEFAVWALTEYGFRTVIAPGFADIFHNNALKNGLLPVTLPEHQVAMLWDLVEEQPDSAIVIDLAAQTVTLPDGQQANFAIDPYRKFCLLHGVDDLGYLLSKDPEIAAFEASQARNK